MIRCVAVDDEPRALDIFQDFAARVPFLKLEAVCNDPLEAFAIIKSIKPDLLFLDIQMPEISGIRLAKEVERPPYVIFVTAFSKYAVEGFNLDAIDFLLKPYSFERFYKAVTKAAETIELHQRAVDFPKADDYIVVKSEYQNRKINLDDILFVEAMDNYVKIHTSESVILTLMNLKSISALLPQSRFIRIHKSFLISRSKINVFTRNYVIIGQKQVPVGRAYANAFLAVMRL